LKRKSILLVFLAFVLVLAAAMFAVACGSGGTTTTAAPATTASTAAPATTASTAPASTETTAAGSSTTAAAAPSGQPIKIGTSLPLTGAKSAPGNAAKQGYLVWQDMINSAGGLLGRPVELVIKDDASDQNTIVADYNALISQDKVDLLLGTFSSLLVLPSSAVAEKNGMVYVTPTGAAPEIYERGFTKIFMSQQALAPDAGKVWANWIVSLPADVRPKTAAYPTQDDPFTAPVIQGIKKIFEGAGIRTVYDITYPADQTDFDSIVNAIKAAKPDAVVHGAVADDGPALVNGMLKAGFKPGWLFQTTAPSLGTQYSDAIGPENTEGIFYHMSYNEKANTPGNAEFIKRYYEMYPDAKDIPEDVADAFAAGEVLAAAVTSVGAIDQQKIADWLHANEVETILGPLSWDAQGRPQGEFMIAQWQKGKTEIVLPESVATAPPIMGWKPGTPVPAQ
jgi:branched-chain amino acid transport system substrate-binding protein